MPHFQRYIGIDYSGAQTPTSNLSGLSIFVASSGELPVEISPPRGRSKYWTRRGVAEWLSAELLVGPPTLVGIDHCFSFPIQYFEFYKLPLSWPEFLDDFHKHWPTDQDHMRVDFIRNGQYGEGAARTGSSRWRRMTEERCRAKSVFHFDVQGSVAKSSHAGIPWLRYLRGHVGTHLHFWPFDGWTPSHGCSVITEVYPALWSKTFSAENRNSHQHDAYSIARWMQLNDFYDALSTYFAPNLSSSEREVAQVEGWIFGQL